MSGPLTWSLDAEDHVEAERRLDDLAHLARLELEGGVGERRRDVTALDAADASVVAHPARVVAELAHRVRERRPLP